MAATELVNTTLFTVPVSAQAFNTLRVPLIAGDITSFWFLGEFMGAGDAT